MYHILKKNYFSWLFTYALTTHMCPTKSFNRCFSVTNTTNRERKQWKKCAVVQWKWRILYSTNSYSKSKCDIPAGIYEAQPLLVLVTDNRQSCLDPTVVQETEIPSPFAESVLEMYKIHSFSVKDISMQMQIKIHHSVTTTLLDYYYVYKYI